jgi:Mg2+ and Co2+ transporter CorA
MNDSGSHPGERPKAGQRKTIGGILASALDMEDQISQGVYEDYLDRSKWPSQFDEGVFQDIRERLTTLVEDTKKHRKILEALSREYDDQAK